MRTICTWARSVAAQAGSHHIPTTIIHRKQTFHPYVGPLGRFRRGRIQEETVDHGWIIAYKESTLPGGLGKSDRGMSSASSQGVWLTSGGDLATFTAGPMQPPIVIYYTEPVNAESPAISDYHRQWPRAVVAIEGLSGIELGLARFVERNDLDL